MRALVDVMGKIQFPNFQRNMNSHRASSTRSYHPYRKYNRAHQMKRIYCMSLTEHCEIFFILALDHGIAIQQTTKRKSTFHRIDCDANTHNARVHV